MSDPISLDARTDRLEHNATFVGVLVALVLGIALLFVQPVVGIAVAVLLGGAWVLLVRTRLAGGVDRVGAELGAVPLQPGSSPRLENVLEGLCGTSGVTDPSLALIESQAMNGLVAADREKTSVVLTTGLVDGLGRLELEGVLANLLGRVRDGSARHTTTVLALLGEVPTAARMLQSGLGEQRDVRTDLAAVDLTRYPPGLISALVAMDRNGTHVDGASAATSALWLAPAVGSDTGDADAQPLPLRIAVLAEL